MIYNVTVVTVLVCVVAFCAVRFENSNILWFWLAVPFFTASYKSHENDEGEKDDLQER